MSPDLVPLVVGSSLGVGVVAGIISGIIFVVVQGFRSNDGSKTFNYNPWRCCVCDADFRPLPQKRTTTAKRTTNVRDLGHTVACERCGGRACRAGCAILSRKHHVWLCRACDDRPDSWFRTVLAAIQPASFKARMSQQPESVDGTELAAAAATADEERQKVRDFMATLVGAMLGDEDVVHQSAPIARLYDHPEYLPVSGQSPCSAHAALKQLVQRVLREAARLPFIGEPRPHQELEAFAANVGGDSAGAYEDLLAAAILNKVIESYQKEVRIAAASSSVAETESRASSRSRDRWTVSADAETASVSSSVEEWCRSDCGRTKRVDRQSLTICHQEAEDARSSGSSSSSSSDESTGRARRRHRHHHRTRSPLVEVEDEGQIWEDNWLFQRKKQQSSAAMVPMLVPSSNTECKPLIGEKAAEDTSDLSETDLGEEEENAFGTASAGLGIEAILVESRTLIGGKNPLVETVNLEALERELKEAAAQGEAEAEADAEVEAEAAEAVEPVAEAKNDGLIQEISTVDDASLDSYEEKDRDCTENYASLPRQIEIKTNNSHPLETDQVEKEEAEEDEEAQFKGSYSERERQKWKNPIALQNNHYSRENLERRLEIGSGNWHIFGRDYYIREAKKASGSRKYNSASSGDEVHSPQSPLGDISEEMTFRFNPPSETATTTTTTTTITTPSNDGSNTSSIVYTAVPATVVEWSEDMPPSIIASTDSEETDIKRVYNVETGLVHKVPLEEVEPLTRKFNSSLELSNVEEAVSVKDLRKKFSEPTTGLTRARSSTELLLAEEDLKPMHSLTARTLSKEFRQELRKTYPQQNGHENTVLPQRNDEEVVQLARAPSVRELRKLFDNS